MSSDSYHGFAERYDRFGGGFRSRAPIVETFFRTLFDSHNVQTVLDTACGTGKDLVMFHRLGRKVTGADLSAAMLDQARKNLSQAAVEIPLHHVDFRNLREYFASPFDAVVCLTSSIAELPNDDEALRALLNMRGVLRNGGVLVLSQGTSDRQWNEQPRFILSNDTPEVTRLFAIDYLGGRDAIYHILDIVRSNGTASLEVWSKRLHFLFRNDQIRLLKEAGFTRVEFYGEYNGTPYDPLTSQRLITVAHA